MIEECLKSSTTSLELGSTDMPTDTSIPVASLIIIEERLKGVSVRALKDDGCTTNVISKEFFATHPNLFETREVPVVVSHSKKGTTEVSNMIIPNTTLKMGSPLLLELGGC